MVGRTGRPRLAPIEDPTLEPAEHILIVASKLFAEKGFATTTTREIAQAAGIQQPSLYYWFQTKFDILNRLVESGIVESGKFARRIRRLDSPAIVSLYALLLFDTRQLCASPYDLSFLSGAPELKDPRLTYRPHLKLLYDAVDSLIIRGIGEGSLVEVDPKVARPAMMALNAVAMRFRLKPEDIEPTVRTLVRYSVRGLAADGVDLDQVEAEAQSLSKP